MLSEPAARVIDRYLARVDSASPGLVRNFYLVGSLALGGFRAGRSDIDFVATVARTGSSTLGALRSVHRLSYLEGIVRAARSGSWPLVCNGIFLASEEDLAQPPAAVVPVASQSAERFSAGGRDGLNPVTWWILAHGGIPRRGPAPSELGVRLDDDALRSWTAENLVSYWLPWADALHGAGPRSWAAWSRHLSFRRTVATGVLGTARMHATVSTGRVITKEQAGEYALTTFESAWHPVIEEALAYWRGFPRRRECSITRLRIEGASFVHHVIEAVGPR